MKIVLIEDDKILSKVIYEELKEAGFVVHRAYDGIEGLKLVKSKKPDLVLLDLILPGKHGFNVLKELKASSETNGIPVIILTMLGSDDDIKKGLVLGANDYIVKSQHAVSEIIEKVRDFLGQEMRPEAKQPKEQKKEEEQEEGEEQEEIKKKKTKKKK